VNLGGFSWTESKAKLLRTIGNANAVGRELRINDFNRRDVDWFVKIGLATVGERGPVLTEAGRAQFEKLPTPKDRRGHRVTVDRA
jgi:hypothetical protein